MMMTGRSKATIAALIVSLVAYLGLGAIAANADNAPTPASNDKSCKASVVRTGGPDEASHAVAFAAPELDTRYLISSGGYFQVSAVDGMTVTTVNAVNNTVDWYGGLISAPRGTDKAAVEAIWPLEIGKTVTFLEQSGKDAWCHTVSVLRAESISVQAGKFDTIVVAERLQSLRPEQGNLDVTRTYWYAPTVHWAVKRAIKQVSGPPYSYVSYELTQMVAASSRAGVQVARAPGSEKCVASVVKAGGPDAAKNAVAFSPPTLETRYLVNSGYYQVASVDGMTVTTVNASNRTYTWLAGMIYAPNQMDKASVEAIWPLEIGKRVTFLERSGKDAWCHTVDILRAESINVPAGSFETIVLEEQIKSVEPAQGSLDVRRTYWYAPAVHWTVKKEVKQIAGPPFGSEPYELTQMVTAASRPPTVNSRWAKINCGDAHIDLPFAEPHDCYRGPIGKGDTGDCHAERYGTAGGDNTVQFEIYLTLGGGRCGIYFSEADIQSYTQDATAMSRNGLDFSALKRFGGAEVVSFTGRGRQGPLSCFAFARLGPILHRDAGLYRYTMRGHVCRTDGTTLSDADIEPLARAIGVD